MEPGTKSAARDLGLLILLGTLWGLPYALTKISLETIPPVTATAGRVTLAATALWIIAAYSKQSFVWRWDLVGRLFLQGAITCVVPYTLIAFGQQTVDSGLASILNSTTPLFVCIISVAWTHHELMSARRMSGAVIGLAGVTLIVGAGAIFELGEPTAGHGAILLATVSSAMSVIHGRRFNGLAPELVAASMLTCAAILLIPISLVVEPPWSIAPSAASLAALAANAIGATAIGFAIYFRLIRTVGPMGTASAGYLKPSIAVLIGCTVMGEPWTWTLALGLTSILLSIAIINENIPFSRNQRQRTAAEHLAP